MKLFRKNITFKKILLKLIKYKSLIKDFIIKDLFGKNTLPGFLIAGVQKSGTSALAYYLSQHPRLQQAYNKEVGFFNTKRYSSYGIKWYKKQFPARLKKVQYFEATPDYIYLPSFAERLYNHNKDMKIILILRDPIKRAYSAWNMFKEINAYPEQQKNVIISNYVDVLEDSKTKGFFTDFLRSENYPDFSNYIKMELDLIGKDSPTEPSFIRKGLYYEQIKHLLEYFSLDSILIIENDDLKNNREKTLERVFDFLGVEKPGKNLKTEEIGVRNYVEPISSDCQKTLSDFYKPYNEKLYDLINEKFKWE